MLILQALSRVGAPVETKQEKIDQKIETFKILGISLTTNTKMLNLLDKLRMW